MDAEKAASTLPLLWFEAWPGVGQIPSERSGQTEQRIPALSLSTASREYFLKRYSFLVLPGLVSFQIDLVLKLFN